MRFPLLLRIFYLRQSRTCQHVKVGADVTSNADNAADATVLVVAAIMTRICWSIFFSSSEIMQPITLTLAEAAGTPVLTTRSTNPGTAPGIRLFGGRLRKNGIGWEFGYTGVFGMFGERTVRDPSTLKVPDPLGAQAGWDNLDAIRSSYTSSLNMCEVNLFTSETTVKGGPRSPFPWHRVHGTFEHEFQWLGGFRWAGFNDVANLYPDASVISGNNDGTYTITTNSQMLGPQIGFKTKRRWNNWSIEGWTKATLAGTFLNADSAPIFTQASPVVPYRPQASARDVGVGFIGDMNYSIVRRLNRKWSLRAGYNLIWVSGVALAPNQFDFSLNQHNNPCWGWQRLSTWCESWA